MPEFEKSLEVKRKLRRNNFRTIWCNAGIHCTAPYCTFAHSVYELQVRFVPSKFKQVKCRNFSKCTYNEHCWFLHNEIQYNMPNCEFCSIFCDRDDCLLAKICRGTRRDYFKCQCFEKEIVSRTNVQQSFSKNPMYHHHQPKMLYDSQFPTIDVPIYTDYYQTSYYHYLQMPNNNDNNNNNVDICSSTDANEESTDNDM